MPTSKPIQTAFNVSLARLDATRPRTVLAATVAVFAGIWSVRDYLLWTRVDGGVPKYPFVWILSKILHWSTSPHYVTDRYVRKLSSDVDATRALKDLPRRTGPIPRLLPWAVPHRHEPQLYSPEMLDRIITSVRDLGSKHGLLLSHSIREGHRGLAIYAKHAGSQPDFLSDKLHIHPGDGSVHVTLHPRDAAEVCEKGWGAPFVFAGIWKIEKGVVLVYAPRNDEEFQVVQSIMDASVQFILGHIAA